MRKHWLFTVIAVTTFTGFSSCSDDDDVPTPPETPVTGAYILNTGGMGSNNSSLQLYDPRTNAISGDIFEKNNARKLGDTANDLYIYGSKMYIAVSTSGKIEVLNTKGANVIKTLTLKNEAEQPISPRFFTAAGDNVYFTAYDGTVSRIDTTSLEITGKLNLGGFPEALTNANGKLYINQSKYYTMPDGGNTISVVDIATFTKTKDLEVLLNPSEVSLTADNGKVYFVSVGDYADLRPTLQCIDPQTDIVTQICLASKVANKGNKMYILYSEWGVEDSKEISVLDLTTGVKTKFIDSKQFSNPYTIDIDPTSGNVYIGDVSYSSMSNMYVFDSEGNLINTFETGIGTAGAFFVTQ